MNILVSTTIGHNPGDELIFDGVMNLLKEVLPGPLNVFIYNRNPDLQGAGREAVTGTVGNYQCGDVDLSYIDLVVLAGSPEWTGGPMKALYNALLASPRRVPMWALGVGKGAPRIEWTELDEKVFRRPQTCVITRSLETAEALHLKGIHAIPMVCPAFFSSPARSYGIPYLGTLNIVQRPGSGWHEVPERILKGPSPLLNEYELLCVHQKEFKFYSDLGYSPRFARTTTEFRDIVDEYGRVHSTRLHGAIGALALGVPSVVVSNGDYRIETAAKMFREFLPVAKNFEEAAKKPLLSSLPIKDFQDLHRDVWIKELRSYA